MSNASKTKQFARLIRGSSHFWHSLEKLRENYISNKEPKYLAIPYVLTCAAYLEARLNDALYETRNQYGEEFANAMCWLSLPNKLKILVPTLTKGRYEINKGHVIFKRLNSLIKTRNLIAHRKPEFEEISVSIDELVEIPIFNAGMTKIPKKFVGEPALFKEFSPLEYHEALEKLEQWFFSRCPKKLGKVAMVKKRTKSGGWKEVSTTWVKYLD